MKNKLWIWVLTVVWTTTLWAHEEGHGQRLTDTPIYGGVVSPVIRERGIKWISKAPWVYKGELIRSEDGTIRIYIYTPDMKPKVLSQFEKRGKAVLETKINSRWKTQDISLTLSGNTFIGRLPKEKVKKPYNLDVYITENNTVYFVSFEHLD